MARKWDLVLEDNKSGKGFSRPPSPRHMPSSCWKRPLPKPKGVSQDDGVVKKPMKTERKERKEKKEKKEKKDRKEKTGENEISPKLVPVKMEEDGEVPEEFPDKSWLECNAEEERQHYRKAELSPTEPPDDDEENERLNQEIQEALKDSLLLCLAGKTCFKVIAVYEMISI